MRKCILCNAKEEIREAIETLVQQGFNYKEASEKAKKLGLDVSHTSVQRHIENHTDIVAKITENAALETNSDCSIAIVDDPKIDDWQRLDDYMSEVMPTVIGRQVALVDSKQQSFMNGEGRYPKEETRQLMDYIKLLKKSPKKQLDEAKSLVILQKEFLEETDPDNLMNFIEMMRGFNGWLASKVEG